jgi:hypothetical protein
MSSDLTPDNSHSKKLPGRADDNQRLSQSDETKPELKHPEQIGSRSLDHHHPIALTLSNVSAATLELLLQDMFPEIASGIAESIRQIIIQGETIPYDPLQDAYSGSVYYTMSQHRQFVLGPQRMEESSHRVLIQRHGDEEPCLFELSLGNSSLRSVDLTVVYRWTEESERWTKVDELGALLGLDALSERFAAAPTDLFEDDDSGFCMTLMSNDISIRTQRVGEGTEASATSRSRSGMASHWAPTSIQVASPDYGEQAGIVRAISSELADNLLQSGVLKTMDAFSAGGELKPNLLQRASGRLPQEIVVDFARTVTLGPLESYLDRDDEGIAEEEFCQERGFDSEGEQEYNPDEGEEPDEEERAPFSYEPLTALPITSSSAIHAYAQAVGLMRLELNSTGRAHGLILLNGGRAYNFAAPVMGVHFLKSPSSLREIAVRWRVVLGVATIGECVVNRKELEANLFLGGVNPGGKPVSADVGAGRVLMAFTPPQES